MCPAHRLPKPTTTVRAGQATLRFYNTDSLDLLARLAPRSVGVIVTSPPYNLGVRYRSYHDALSGEQYLQWTRDWIAGAARVLTDEGSLFLNVGSKPVRPWTAYDVAAEARQHLELQNTRGTCKTLRVEKFFGGLRTVRATSHRRELTKQALSHPQRQRLHCHNDSV